MEYNEKIAQHRELAVNTIINICKNKSLAEDIVHDAYSSRLLNKEGVENKNLESYVATACKWELYDYYRDRKEGRDVLGNSAGLEEWSFDKEIGVQEELSIDMAPIHRYISKLPKIQQEIIRMSVLGFDHDSIAERLGLSNLGVRGRLHEIRKKANKTLRV